MARTRAYVFPVESAIDQLTGFAEKLLSDRLFERLEVLEAVDHADVTSLL